MATTLEVLLAPAEFAALEKRDLSKTVCVVFDILRATSTMLTALANGALEIVPVAEIAEALAHRRQRPDTLLAGERDGLRIRADQTGGVDFDLGNSPREFTAERVRGRIIVMTTTNGTRALKACASARTVLLGTFLGMRALADWLVEKQPSNLLLVCSGTVDQSSYEDALAAGALSDQIWPAYERGIVSDSAEMVRQIYRLAQDDLLKAMPRARNGRRLLAHSELREDVTHCLQRDTVHLVAELTPNGVVRKHAYTLP